MSIDFLYIFIVLVVILFSMTLHEAMHAFASYWLGDHTAKMHGRLSLNPIKHIDPFLTIILPITLALIGAPIFGGAKPVPFNPYNVRFGEWGAALVAIAGPVTNFIIAFLAFGVWAVSGVSEQTILGQVLAITVYVNLGFFIFNMIPIPPLDGSRVIYALAPEFVRRGMEAIEGFGIIFIFAVVFIMGPYIGMFIYTVMHYIINLFEFIFII
jgi:Zn-dependent protease